MLYPAELRVHYGAATRRGFEIVQGVFGPISGKLDNAAPRTICLDLDDFKPNYLLLGVLRRRLGRWKANTVFAATNPACAGVRKDSTYTHQTPLADTGMAFARRRGSFLPQLFLHCAFSLVAASMVDAEKIPSSYTNALHGCCCHYHQRATRHGAVDFARCRNGGFF